MTSHQKDYWWLALSLSPFVAIPLGIAFFAAENYVLGLFLVCYGGSASIGCVRLLNEFWHHGIHNDR